MEQHVIIMGSEHVMGNPEGYDKQAGSNVRYIIYTKVMMRFRVIVNRKINDNLEDLARLRH